jgi:membrane protein YqaA with SNARE-associated domain
MLRRLYDWVVKWADTPYGTWALFVFAFAESSFFPIPPDALLIALGVAVPKKSLKLALICSVASVFGGMFGYFIGWHFMSLLGDPIIAFYGFEGKFEQIRQLYQRYDAWAIGIAGFTPIPYKVFTISAGAFHINFITFILASAFSRSARFFLVGGLLYIFGAKIQAFINRYFDMLAVAFTILLIAGFVVVKLVF